MFVLTCPHCEHTTQVRFARMGATATCPECREQYKVSRDTMVVEDDERPKPTPVTPLTFDAPAAQSSGEVDPELAELDQESEISVDDVLMATGAAKTIDGNARRAVARQRLKRRKRKSDSPLIIISLVSMVALVGFIIWLMLPGDNPPVGPGPGPGPGPNNGHTTHPDPPDGPDLPSLKKLLVSDVPEPAWRMLSPAQAAMAEEPAPGVNVKIWRTQFDNGGRRGPTVSVMFVADVPGVYTGVTLKVQLLNADGQAFAERVLPMPDIIPREGFFHHVSVPAALADETGSVRSSLNITKAEREFDLLEQNQTQFTVHHETDKEGIVEGKVHNRNTRPISNPKFVLEAYLLDRRLEKRSVGQLEAYVPAGGQTSFLVTIPKPADSSRQLGRLLVRGYGGSN